MIIIKKKSDGVFNIFENKKQVGQIIDTFPRIKQTTRNYKSFYLWVKIGKTYYKHKIKWFYSIADVKKWIREFGLSWDDFISVNGLDRKTYSRNIVTQEVRYE